ncbi:MAG: polyphosphate kinase 1, partial [Floccifex sp.]
LEKEVVQPLLYKPYKGRWPEDIVQNQRMMEQIRKKDELLFYPYDSVEPFLKLLNEAAENPDVLSIKITIYRLASSSKIAKTLCRAAEKGKEVLVLMEVRARFDEAHNLEWAKMLEESGCQVIYGMEGFKCHSKICLITMRHRGKMSYITQIGTGNYNEKTNAMYTDLSLMTANSSIGEEATLFFRNMLTNNLEGNYKTLHVSPFGIKNMICEKIDEQIQLGSDGYICIKANSITEKDMIKKLCEASQAGVEIQLIIRGICCILPGIPEYTENIHITSIVGRYLEHARIYLFGKGKNESLYISSADLMTRNLNRRVEIACPIYDETIRKELKWILDAQLKDTAKASLMLSDGTYSRKQSIESFDSQAYFMKESFHVPVLQEQTKESFTKQISQLWNMVFHNSNMG